VLVAYADVSDPDHQRCLRLLDASSEDLITTEPVVAETGWLVDRQLGPATEAAFYRSVARGELTVERLGLADWERIAELTQTYADNDLGGVDSSLVAVAERLRIETIATLDRRHFGAVRPEHLEAFAIVP
jgi:uncharacterized protein